MPEATSGSFWGRAVYGTGRTVQACGYMLCLCGIVLAGYQVLSGQGLGGWLIALQERLLGDADLPQSTTVAGALLVVPGLAVSQLGAWIMRRGRPADPLAESRRIARFQDRLFGHRPLTSQRVLAVALCMLVAIASIAGMAGLLRTTMDGHSSTASPQLP